MVSAALAGAPAVETMARLLAGIGQTFGMERSARLRRHRIEMRRLLLSQARHAFSPSAWQTLRDGCSTLGLPAGLWTSASERAAFLHLGHVGDPPETLKLYLEYIVPPTALDGTLLYEAWKWHPGETARRDSYRLLLPATARTYLSEQARDAGPLGRIAQALVAWLPRDASLFALDASGDRQRRSIVLRLYDQRETIGALRPVLEVAADALEIDADSIEALLVERGPERLGNVALGQGSDGAPFITVYGGAFGVLPKDVL
jgi:tryptophan halogenase